MKLSTTFIAALGFVSLAACGSKADDDAVNMDNMDANMAVDNMGMDANMAGANMAANGTMNAADGMNATENAMAKDMNTNDKDTNLANGM